MSSLPQYKTGDCSQCGDNNVPCVKVGKLLFCKFKCHKNNKAKQQMDKAKLKQQVRGLVNKQNNMVEKKTYLSKWFESTRKKLTGTCQCGCSAKSQKNDDMYYKFSCCHLFPKRIFKSIATHPLNYVERAFFGGCHSNLDDQSMDKWVNMADWDDMKEKFHELAPLLTDEERANKFYAHFEKLIYGKLG